jgi:serpin B
VISRRDTLRALAAAGLVAPALAACGDTRSGSTRSTDSSGPVRVVSAHVPRSAGDPQAVPGAVAAMAAFTTDLWDTLPAGDNLALSPYSIAVALAMTANGAVGTTQQQMLGTLHVDSLATYNRALSALTQEIEALAGPVRLVDGSKAEISLSSADALFGDGATTWRRAFLTLLAKEYGAGMHTVDWRHATEAARRSVNAWTSARTHDRIPQILPPGSVDELTRLVLVNALYFKAPWQVPLDKSATHDGTFHRADGTRTRAPMMNADVGVASYVSGPDWEGARLPYADRTLAMTLALPHPGAEARALRDLLAHGLVADGTPDVTLTLPRWTYRVDTDLVRPLQRLGMLQAFTDGADFSAMTTDAELAVSDVLHQTFVAVDEAGTEAAAATAVVMGETALPVTNHALVLDRPFLFVIHDTAHGTPLFVGRVADPS